MFFMYIVTVSIPSAGTPFRYRMNRFPQRYGIPPEPPIPEYSGSAGYGYLIEKTGCGPTKAKPQTPFSFAAALAFRYLCTREKKYLPKTTRMKSAEFSRRKIWNITYPVLISLLMEHLIGMTDTAFMGHVGEVELGASAIAGIYYMVLYMLGFGFSVGAEILMARRNGERQYRSIGNIFFQGSVILLAIAAAVTLLSYTVSPVLLRAILSSPAIYDATTSYIDLRIWGLFFSLTACMFRAFYMATTRTSILTLNGIVMVLSNVVLNYLFVFGKLGLPAMGIAGAALGSTISEFISVLFFVLYTRTRTDYKRYGLFRITRLSPLIQKQIFRVSGWTTVQYFISSATWLFFFLAIEHLGERPLAISNIVRSISAFFYMFVSAFASTGTAIVSNLMGKGKPHEVVPVCFRIMKMCAAAILPLFLLAMAFPELIMRIFTDNGFLIASAVPSMRVMLFIYVLNVPAYVFFLAVSGTGNTRQAFFIELAATILYVAYICLIAVWLRSDIAVCWTSDAVYALVLLVLSYAYLKKAKWQTRKI